LVEPRNAQNRTAPEERRGPNIYSDAALWRFGSTHCDAFVRASGPFGPVFAEADQEFFGEVIDEAKPAPVAHRTSASLFRIFGTTLVLTLRTGKPVSPADGFWYHRRLREHVQIATI
jgi:hypothetical protein